MGGEIRCAGGWTQGPRGALALRVNMPVRLRFRHPGADRGRRSTLRGPASSTSTRAFSFGAQWASWRQVEGTWPCATGDELNPFIDPCIESWGPT